MTGTDTTLSTSRNITPQQIKTIQQSIDQDSVFFNIQVLNDLNDVRNLSSQQTNLLRNPIVQDGLINLKNKLTEPGAQSTHNPYQKLMISRFEDGYALIPLKHSKTVFSGPRIRIKVDDQNMMSSKAKVPGVIVKPQSTPQPEPTSFQQPSSGDSAPLAYAIAIPVNQPTPNQTQQHQQGNQYTPTQTPLLVQATPLPTQTHPTQQAPTGPTSSTYSSTLPAHSVPHRTQKKEFTLTDLEPFKKTTGIEFNKELSSTKNYPTAQALFDAIKHKDTDEAIALIETSIKPSDLLTFEGNGSIKNTPLLEAIITGQTEIAIALIKADKTGRSLIVPDNIHNTNNHPLLLSLKMGNKRLVNAILTQLTQLQDSNPTLVRKIVNNNDARGFTALHWAGIQRNNQAIEALLGLNAQIDQKNIFNKTAGDYYQTPISYNDLKLKPNVKMQTADTLNGLTNVEDFSDLRWHLIANAEDNMDAFASAHLRQEIVKVPGSGFDEIRVPQLLDAARFLFIESRNSRPVDAQIHEVLTGQPLGNPPQLGENKEIDYIQSRIQQLEKMIPKSSL